MKRVYLAIPYSYNPEQSHRIANLVSADLMKQGHVVFSPISHSHHIADHLPNWIKTDYKWWMAQDLPLVEWADEVHVVCVGEFGHYLIENSKGVQAELAHAKLHNKPIKIVEYYE